MRSLFIRLCVLTVIAFVACLFGPGVSGAQEIKGPIKIIVPYPAGGGSDVVARFVAEKLKTSLGQTVIVENKTGAGGRIGTEYAKTQPADGTAMLVVNPALFVVAPLVFSKLGYDPDADFAPVSLITTYQFCVSVPPASPIKNVKGLVEWIKQNPNQANYGSPAAGSLPHFFGLMIGKAAGVFALGGVVNPNMGRNLIAGIPAHEYKLVGIVQQPIPGSGEVAAIHLIELPGDLLPTSLGVGVNEELVQWGLAEVRQYCSGQDDRGFVSVQGAHCGLPMKGKGCRQ